MGTKLIIGAILTASGCITIAVCYLGSHNPKEPKWTCEMIMGNLIIPLVIGAIVLGPMLLGEALLFHWNLLSFNDITIALSILAAGGIMIFLMRIPKRIAAYDVLRNTAGSQKQVDQDKDIGQMGVPTNTLRQGT